MPQPRTKPVEILHKNTYFCHSPWQKCLLSRLKTLFSPSPIAMLFAVTQEMHAWAVKPQQHCTRGGRGASLFLMDTMVAWRDIENWIENVSTVLSGVVGGSRGHWCIAAGYYRHDYFVIWIKEISIAWKEALVRPLLKKVISRLRIRTFLQLATFLTSLNYQKRRKLFNSPIIWQLMACICSFNLHINNITALSRRC